MSHNIFCLMMSTYLTVTNSVPLNHPAPFDLTSSQVVAPFNNIGEVTKVKIAQAVNSKPFSIVPVFPDSGRKHAVLEVEQPLSKADSIYDNLQAFAANLYNPKPLVDTIQEHEKYGNDGGIYRTASVGFIAGVEGVSNLLNAAVDVPFEFVQQLTKKFSNTASALGAKFVGL